MSEFIPGNYVNDTVIKDRLDIADSLDDTEIKEFSEEANIEIDTMLKKTAATIPLTSGTLEFKQAQQAGLVYVKAKWKRKKKQRDEAKSLMAEFVEKMNRLIETLESDPLVNTRTKSTIITADPRDSKIPLPTQYTNFVFDNYA